MARRDDRVCPVVRTFVALGRDSLSKLDLCIACVLPAEHIVLGTVMYVKIPFRLFRNALRARLPVASFSTRVGNS